MEHKQILEAIQKSTEAIRDSIRASLKPDPPTRNSFEAFFESHKHALSIFGLVATILAIYGTVSKLLSEKETQITAAIDKAFTQQLSQTNSDASVVKLIAEQMSTLSGHAVKTMPAPGPDGTAQSDRVVTAKDVSPLWDSKPSVQLANYQKGFDTFEMNHSAIASLQSVFGILLRKPDADADSARRDTDIKAKQERRTNIIAPQLIAGAVSFDPTVRSASLQLSSYLTSPNTNWVELDVSTLSQLKSAFQKQFLGMTNYKGGSASTAGENSSESVWFNLEGYTLSGARFDGSHFDDPVSFKDARLDDCFFNNATFLSGGSFEGSHLNNAIFAGSEIGAAGNGTRKVSFKKTHLDGAQFTGETADTSPQAPKPVVAGPTFRNVEFLEAIFSTGLPPTFSGAKFLQNVVFIDTDLSKVHFDMATLSEVRFTGEKRTALMQEAVFDRITRGPTTDSNQTTQSTEAAPPGSLTFHNIDLTNSQFGSGAVTDAVCDLRNTTFEACVLDGIDFSRATLDETTVTNCNGKMTIFSTTPSDSSAASGLGVPAKIIGGSFTNGSWLVNIPVPNFEEKVRINFAFVTERFKGEIGERFTFINEGVSEEGIKIAICIKPDGKHNEFVGMLQYHAGAPVVFHDASKSYDVSKILGYLNTHAVSFGFEVPERDDKEAWTAIFNEHVPPIQWK